VPQFADLLEVVGATCSSMLALTLPGVCHLRLFGGALGRGRFLAAWSVFVFGGVVFIAGVADLSAGMLAKVMY